MTDQPPTEGDRLARVYQSYRQRRLASAKWDEDQPGNARMVQERMGLLSQALARRGLLPLTGRQVLEVGCGTGRELARLLAWGGEPSHLYGVDLLPDRIAEARASHPDLRFEQQNAEALGFPDASFDLVLVMTVFSSIQDDRMARNVAGEIDRVLKPGGLVVWYDFRYRSPGNPHVHPISRGGIRALFPSYAIDLRSATLLPPLARRLGRLTSAAYPMLARLPALRSHYLGVLDKPR